jgi:hypothetical protein
MGQPEPVKDLPFLTLRPGANWESRRPICPMINSDLPPNKPYEGIDNAGLFGTITPPYHQGEFSMAEEFNTTTEGQQAPQGVQVMLDERDLRTVYCNAYRIHATNDEVVLDLGFNMPDPNPRQGGQQGLLLKVSERAIMSYSNAKKLAISLGQLIKRYEQQFGELPTQPGQRQQPR